MRRTPLVLLSLGITAVVTGVAAVLFAAPASAAALKCDDTERLVQLAAMLPTLQPADNECIDCHQNAELLQQIAVEPEVEKAPSEGSG